MAYPLHGSAQKERIRFALCCVAVLLRRFLCQRAEGCSAIWNGKGGKRPCHQICLYYNVHLMDDNIPLDGVFHGYDELDNERIDLDFCWVPLEDLKKGTKVYPLELIPYILEPGKEIVHFVSKQI